MSATSAESLQRAVALSDLRRRQQVVVGDIPVLAYHNYRKELLPLCAADRQQAEQDLPRLQAWLQQLTSNNKLAADTSPLLDRAAVCGRLENYFEGLENQQKVHRRQQVDAVSRMSAKVARVHRGALVGESSEESRAMAGPAADTSDLSVEKSLERARQNATAGELLKVWPVARKNAPRSQYIKSDQQALSELLHLAKHRPLSESKVSSSRMSENDDMTDVPVFTAAAASSPPVAPAAAAAAATSVASNVSNHMITVNDGDIDMSEQQDEDATDDDDDDDGHLGRTYPSLAMQNAASLWASVAAGVRAAAAGEPPVQVAAAAAASSSGSNMHDAISAQNRLIGIDAEMEQRFYAYADQLFTFGSVVIPALNVQRLMQYRSLFEASKNNFPEYLDPAKTAQFVGGGFSALGNPSSFHCPIARKVRASMMSLAVLLFQQYERIWRERHPLMPRRHLQQLFDRLLMRPPGKTATSETFHRDHSPNKAPLDECFGGWLNLDAPGSAPQGFSFVPATQWEPRVDPNSNASKTGPAESRPDASGFIKITKKIIEDRQYHQHKQRQFVYPGDWIVFNQVIAHEVLSGKQNGFVQQRQFLGWRLSVSADPLFSDNAQVMDDQAVPRLPSGQTPRMYPKLAWNYTLQRHNMELWSHQSFVPRCLTQRVLKVHNDTRTVVYEHMPSLKALGLPMYAPYTSFEREIMLPRQQWTGTHENSDVAYTISLHGSQP